MWEREHGPIYPIVPVDRWKEWIEELQLRTEGMNADLFFWFWLGLVCFKSFCSISFWLEKKVRSTVWVFFSKFITCCAIAGLSYANCKLSSRSQKFMISKNCYGNFSGKTQHIYLLSPDRKIGSLQQTKVWIRPKSSLVNQWILLELLVAIWVRGYFYISRNEWDSGIIKAIPSLEL